MGAAGSGTSSGSVEHSGSSSVVHASSRTPLLSRYQAGKPCSATVGPTSVSRPVRTDRLPSGLVGATGTAIALAVAPRTRVPANTATRPRGRRHDRPGDAPAGVVPPWRGEGMKLIWWRLLSVITGRLGPSRVSEPPWRLLGPDLDGPADATPQAPPRRRSPGSGPGSSRALSARPPPRIVRRPRAGNHYVGWGALNSVEGCAPAFVPSVVT